MKEDMYRERHLENIHTKDYEYNKIFNNTNGKVLEIGSYPFVMTEMFCAKGFDVKGVDYAYANDTLHVIKLDVEKEPLPFKEEFDTVTMVDVFEHLTYNPIYALLNSKKVLKKDGVLIITTPNFFRLKNIYNMIFRRVAGDDVLRAILREEGFMGHLREYTMKEMVNILNHCGFKISKKEYVVGGEKGIFKLIVLILPFLRNELFFVLKKEQVSINENRM
jgi:2-polyprenyl-3-methyl-5-hydroxy-6-metoxy-1,4-benzoquinol methylase